MNLKDIEIYLPRYLSADSKAELYASLQDFPDNLDSRFYTNKLNELIIYQGDGISKLLAVNLPNIDVKEIDGLILSNTCDLEISNQRVFPSHIVYAPILNLKNYEDQLTKILNKEKLINHISDIRKQKITQILYLPKFEDILEESIVYLDKIYNIPNEFVERQNLNKLRIFSLSDYGNYMILFKLSMHFTRMQDKVDRGSVRI